ncbi:MAG: hypothetical protein JWM85_1067 [Acidimicrobiaceae bacterium]|nr:hypothetical protein [Acidimicrobiaceae bacterium]
MATIGRDAPSLEELRQEHEALASELRLTIETLAPTVARARTLTVRYEVAWNAEEATWEPDKWVQFGEDAFYERSGRGLVGDLTSQLVQLIETIEEDADAQASPPPPTAAPDDAARAESSEEEVVVVPEEPSEHDEMVMAADWLPLARDKFTDHIVSLRALVLDSVNDLDRLLPNGHGENITVLTQIETALFDCLQRFDEHTRVVEMLGRGIISDEALARLKGVSKR